MSYCQLQRGFFILRPCDQQAVKACTQCNRPVCQSHLSVKSGFQLCVDCAKQHKSDYYDDDWVYSYRNSYYGSGYRPFMYGHHDYQSFDRYDNDVDDFDNDSDVGDFSDS
ncbi:MAG TPA: hypothetical protein PKY82_08360 [Pyrinomonadaceae bacterium]|nr:hypothetical protein [Pyrinomonadaceae bacterium]